MNFIKYPLELLLHYIDNGKFFREPMKIYYILSGLIAFVIPLAATYYLYDNWDSTFRYMEGWTKFTSELGAILVVVWLYLMAYGIFVYWMNRKENLSKTVRIGDSITAIPVLAHYVQCSGESTGLMLGLGPLGAYILMYVMLFLNGFKVFTYEFKFGDFIKYALLGIVVFVVLAFVLFIVCYPIILFSHVIGEKLRIKAQLANDLRDVSDIHRAATMTEAPSEQPVETPTEEE